MLHWNDDEWNIPTRKMAKIGYFKVNKLSQLTRSVLSPLHRFSIMDKCRGNRISCDWIWAPWIRCWCALIRCARCTQWYWMESMMAPIQRSTRSLTEYKLTAKYCQFITWMCALSRVDTSSFDLLTLVNRMPTTWMQLIFWLFHNEHASHALILSHFCMQWTVKKRKFRFDTPTTTKGSNNTNKYGQNSLRANDSLHNNYLISHSQLHFDKRSQFGFDISWRLHWWTHRSLKSMEKIMNFFFLAH